MHKSIFLKNVSYYVLLIYNLYKLTFPTYEERTCLYFNNEKLS